MNAPRIPEHSAETMRKLAIAGEQFCETTVSYRLAVKEILSTLTPDEKLQLAILRSYPPQWGGCNCDSKHNQYVEKFS